MGRVIISIALVICSVTFYYFVSFCIYASFIHDLVVFLFIYIEHLVLLLNWNEIQKSC